jgi:hypothetical protein
MGEHAIALIAGCLVIRAHWYDAVGKGRGDYRKGRQGVAKGLQLDSYA